MQFKHKRNTLRAMLQAAESTANRYSGAIMLYILSHINMYLHII